MARKEALRLKQLMLMRLVLKLVEMNMLLLVLGGLISLRCV